jgi:hypothetical protein
MKASKSNLLAVVFLQAAVSVFFGCFRWQYDVSEQGVVFTKVRTENSGLMIGELKEDATIGGRPCKRGWVHVMPNGVPVGFTASRSIDLGRLRIPADTWVFQNKDGVVTVCAFPGDTEVQGHLCRGSGGPKGIQAAFYPDGALKEFFLRDDTRIDGVPCKAGILNESIKLHENGRLKGCVLGADYLSGGRTYPRGTQLRFDPDGRVIR